MFLPVCFVVVFFFVVIVVVTVVGRIMCEMLSV